MLGKAVEDGPTVWFPASWGKTEAIIWGVNQWMVEMDQRWVRDGPV